ncbi:MAG TPA: polyprenol phosphomannose-dependent alpha 1,6 mannosyltransferase MptB [Jatrophihabitans sp.]
MRARILLAVTGAGSAAMAVASWWCAAIQAGRDTNTAAFVLFYIGLAAVIGAWLLLGRHVLAGACGARTVTRYALAGAVPLLGAAPFGRDLWAYAAQGNLVRHGIDPYTHGPSAVPGVFTAQVSPRWLDSASPYGPIWLRISHLGVDVSASHPVIAVLLLRLPAMLGLLLCLWALPRLAERFRTTIGAGTPGTGTPGTGTPGTGTPGTGLWLGAASPLTVVLGVGGGHNDLFMLGLVLAGCAVATRGGERMLALGAAIVALGVLVKSPAAIGLAFTVPLYLHANRLDRSVKNVVRACAVAVVSAAAVIVLASLACGLGHGWTSQVNSDSQWISWLSLPSALVLFGRLVSGASPLKHLDGTLRGFRTGGEVLTVVAVVALWFVAISRLKDGRTQLACLSAALGAAALLAPSVQPWYYCWGLALAGFVVTRRVVLWLLAAVGVLFPIMIMPSGSGMESDWRAFPVIAAALLLAAAATFGLESGNLA